MTFNRRFAAFVDATTDVVAARLEKRIASLPVEQLISTPSTRRQHALIDARERARFPYLLRTKIATSYCFCSSSSQNCWQRTIG